MPMRVGGTIPLDHNIARLPLSIFKMPPYGMCLKHLLVFIRVFFILVVSLSILFEETYYISMSYQVSIYQVKVS